MIRATGLLLLACSVTTFGQDPGVLGVVLGHDGRDVVVCTLVPGGPAARAGVAMGERLMAVDGELVRTVVDARARLYKVKPGSKVHLTLKKGDRVRNVDATMATWRGVWGDLEWDRKPLAVGKAAPPWWAERWSPMVPGKAPPTLESLKGKVVCIYLFQAL